MARGKNKETKRRIFFIATVNANDNYSLSVVHRWINESSNWLCQLISFVNAVLLYFLELFLLDFQSQFSCKGFFEALALTSINEWLIYWWISDDWLRRKVGWNGVGNRKAWPYQMIIQQRWLSALYQCICWFLVEINIRNSRGRWKRETGERPDK